jgi:hypothetical protein
MFILILEPVLSAILCIINFQLYMFMYAVELN